MVGDGLGLPCSYVTERHITCILLYLGVPHHRCSDDLKPGD